MEQPKNDKRRSGQSVAFYTALAVCLIAVGVGTWQLLQPQEDASSVSSAVSLPGEASQRPEVPVTGEASLPVAGPEPSATDGEAETEDVSTLKPATKSDAAAPDSASGESKASSDEKSSGSKASSDAKSGESKASSDAKSGESKASSDAKSSGSKASSDAKSSGSKASSDTKSSGSKTSSDSKSSGSKASSDTKSAKPSGDAVRPVEGETVTGFSMDKLLYNETMRDWRTHDGVDIAADAGTAVAAAMSGTVESVAADPIMGTTVVIRHADKWESVYSSLTDMPEVEAGDEVTAGQVIGYVGDTAASEAALGPHLHFSVLNNGAPVDPEAFLS